MSDTAVLEPETAEAIEPAEALETPAEITQNVLGKPRKVKEFTKKEAEEATARFNQTKHDFRVQLLELFERKAHKKLGFTDDFSGFCVYVKEKLDINSTGQAIRYQLESAKVSRTVGQEVPIAIARQLSALPEEKQVSVYNEVMGGPLLERSAAKIEPQIKKLVDRELKAIGGNGHEAPKKRGRPRKDAQEAQEGTSEPRTDVSGTSEGDSPSKAEGPRAWSLEDWQVEVGGTGTYDAPSPKAALDKLKQEVDFAVDQYYEEGNSNEACCAAMFLSLIAYANAQGYDLNALAMEEFKAEDASGKEVYEAAEQAA